MGSSIGWTLRALGRARVREAAERQGSSRKASHGGPLAQSKAGLRYGSAPYYGNRLHEICKSGRNYPCHVGSTADSRRASTSYHSSDHLEFRLYGLPRRCDVRSAPLNAFEPEGSGVAESQSSSSHSPVERTLLRGAVSSFVSLHSPGFGQAFLLKRPGSRDRRLRIFESKRSFTNEGHGPLDRRSAVRSARALQHSAKR